MASNGPGVTRHATPNPPPTSAQLAPTPMVLDKQLASPEASTQAITDNAEKQNMINNIAGGGRATRKMKKKLHSRTCKCKCKCCIRLRMRGSHKHSGRHSKSKLINKKQRQIVSKRIRLNFLHRKIRKNKNNNSYSKTQAQHGGESVATVPQHGVSCTNPADQQCPGNSTQALLDAQRQATVNEQGDKLTP